MPLSTQRIAQETPKTKPNTTPKNQRKTNETHTPRPTKGPNTRNPTKHPIKGNPSAPQGEKKMHFSTPKNPTNAGTSPERWNNPNF